MEAAMNTSPGAPTPHLSASSYITKRKATVASASEIAGRFLLALLFLLSGIGMLGAYSSTVAFMSAGGVPGALLPVVIVTEILGGLAIMIGWKTRVVAFLLAGLSLLTAIIFYHNLVDQTQMRDFLKNLAIAGGLLLLVANGPGPLSLDRRGTKDDSP
jgi:putative oxidoreductase